MNKVAKLIVNFVLIVIIVVGVAVGNSIAFRYEGEINTLLAPPIVDRRGRAAVEQRGTGDVGAHHGGGSRSVAEQG